jgi:hypothetical protein
VICNKDMWYLLFVRVQFSCFYAYTATIWEQLMKIQACLGLNREITRYVVRDCDIYYLLGFNLVVFMHTLQPFESNWWKVWPCSCPQSDAAMYVLRDCGVNFLFGSFKFVVFVQASQKFDRNWWKYNHVHA